MIRMVDVEVSLTGQSVASMRCSPVMVVSGTGRRSMADVMGCFAYCRCAAAVAEQCSFVELVSRWLLAAAARWTVDVE